MVKFDGAIIKITRRQNLGFQKKTKPLYDSRCDETSVAVACAAVLLIIARKLLQSPTAAWENPLRGIIGHVIVPRGIILLTLQIINRSIDQIGNDVHGICIGDLFIFNHN